MNPLDPGLQKLILLSNGHPLAVQALRELRALRAEVVAIAEHGMLPDGDSVNVPTLLWAEDWARK